MPRRLQVFCYRSKTYRSLGGRSSGIDRISGHDPSPPIQANRPQKLRRQYIHLQITIWMAGINPIDGLCLCTLPKRLSTIPHLNIPTFIRNDHSTSMYQGEQRTKKGGVRPSRVHAYQESLINLSIRPESSTPSHSNGTVASDTRQLSSRDSLPSSESSQNQHIESLMVSFYSYPDSRDSVRGGRARMEYDLLGLSSANVAERHPIRYHPFEEFLSETGFGHKPKL
ncbi:hypothetical protein DL98DRAFT_164181 [Cadophora sp. DSE1049]|nr:hypothetical protein DL98DRAFT_164181 [Cadophora sp. DSE1049]